MLKRRELEKLYHNYNDVSHPDADFNPRRNKAVIEETIREAEKYHNTVHTVLDDAMGERIDAVSQYATYRFNRGTMSPDNYFGKKVLSKFAGEHIISKLKAMKSADKLSGKKNPNGFVLL